MGPIFYKNIPKHGSVFMTEPKILGVCHVITKKIFKMGLFFKKKSLRYGYLFHAKSPLKMVRGFKARAAHPRLNQI